jgi:hypothetical protein
MALRIVLALDCDGTMDASGGPVQAAEIAGLASEDVKVYMVSPSPACAALPFNRDALLPDRTQSLKRVRELEPDGKLFVYISDNPGDDARSYETGFTYLHPKDFRLP